MTEPLHIVWIRRDLRMHDHTAVYHAMQQEGKFILVFIFDEEILARFTRKDDWRLSFITDALMQMDEKARQHGSGMMVFIGKPEEIYKQLIEDLKPASIICAEDYEPETQKRDEKIKKLIGAEKFVAFKDHVIFAPWEVKKDDGDPFKVFTPYSKNWLNKFTPADMGEYACEKWDKLASTQSIYQRLSQDKYELLYLSEGTKNTLATVGYNYVPSYITGWDVAEGQTRLGKFVHERMAAYPNKRDMLAEHGTSAISPYLRFGLISIREAMRAAKEIGGGGKWISELIWREFYQMVLYYAPDSTHKEWNETYRALKWDGKEEWFEAWKEGRTGVPVVDAAMRQLVQTGWMHNRARMIVASFLTKDMHVDWRKGEEFFAQYLMDYELSSNVGGWQWAASTGTDAQPYFRIFNPYLQSKKFDPDGVYIRKYVPELRELDNKHIHEPYKYKHEADYPKPVVDHYEEREKALAMFKALKIS